MKILLALLILVPTLCSAQVHKYKAFRTKLAKFNGTEYVTSEVNDVDILVVVNADKDKIQTFGKSFGDYDLVKRLEQEIDADGSTTTRFKAIDSVGTMCDITLLIFSETRRAQHTDTGAIGSLAIGYGDLLMIFYFRKNE